MSWTIRNLQGLLCAIVAVGALGSCRPAPKAEPGLQAQPIAGGGPSDAHLAFARMDPAAQSLAVRHDPFRRRPDTWDRAPGWTSLDLKNIPTLGFAEAEGATAVRVNALRPFADGPIRPMRPFVLRTSAADRERALHCLAQAVYYEAAREPAHGQEAVAQVVLNRVRHPAYPKSVCGVVYQGASLPTGCQFTFTCDGALRWAPEPALWRRAVQVARKALAGYVDRDVGSATHYHAAYVAPYWAPTLVKMTQVGQHIFYRWTGPWGEPAAFTGRYAGREAELTPAILGGDDPRAPRLSSQRKVTLAVGGEVRTYEVLDPSAPGGRRTRVLGTIYPARRPPTREEIQRINANLAAVETRLSGAGAANVAQAAAPTAAKATGGT